MCPAATLERSGSRLGSQRPASSAARRPAARAAPWAHHVVDLPQDLLHLADLGLVLQEDGGVEVGDLTATRRGRGRRRRQGTALLLAWGAHARLPSSALRDRPAEACPPSFACSQPKEQPASWRAQWAPSPAQPSPAHHGVGQLADRLALTGVHERPRLYYLCSRCRRGSRDCSASCAVLKSFPTAGCPRLRLRAAALPPFGSRPVPPAAKLPLQHPLAMPQAASTLSPGAAAATAAAARGRARCDRGAHLRAGPGHSRRGPQSRAPRRHGLLCRGPLQRARPRAARLQSCGMHPSASPGLEGLPTLAGPRWRYRRACTASAKQGSPGCQPAPLPNPPLPLGGRISVLRNSRSTANSLVRGNRGAREAAGRRAAAQHKAHVGRCSLRCRLDRHWVLGS